MPSRYAGGGSWDGFDQSCQARSTRQVAAPISGLSAMSTPQRIHCFADGGLSLPCLIGPGAFWQATEFTGCPAIPVQDCCGDAAAVPVRLARAIAPARPMVVSLRGIIVAPFGGGTE